MTNLAHLPQRGVLSLTGADRVGFLNGLVSNDVALAAPGRAVWAALLTPQGKYLTDFFIFATAEALLLDAPAADIPALLAKLTRYKLRAAVTLADASATYGVYAAWGGAAPVAETVAPDPRLPEAGWRLLSAAPLPETASAAAYAAHRIGLGLPDGAPDLEPEKTLLLEAGFDELGGIAWNKGCYMGQELTARTKYRGLVKRRLLPVEIMGGAAPAGMEIMAGEQAVGEIRSAAGALGLAMLRLDALDKPLTAAGTALRPLPPGWMKL